jgi:hypothetical protein
MCSKEFGVPLFARRQRLTPHHYPQHREADDRNLPAGADQKARSPANA